MITFTPLSGAARSARTTPLAYLLQVDDVKILLDCGSPDWCPEASSSAVTTEDLDKNAYEWETYCQALRDCAATVDLVLISHGDLIHCGLYAYAYSRWNLKAPAYTSLPVQAMGRIAVTEDVEGIRDEQDVGDAPEATEPEEDSMAVEQPATSAPSHKGKYVATLQEVHEAFDSINVLRYQQPCHLQGKAQGITITAFNAGHTLGGTMWKIRSPAAGTILYAVNINHMRERHLDGTVLVRQGATGAFEPLARPDLLITDAERANVRSSRRKDRDAALMDTITSALSSRNSLLLPCDSSTRVLELLVLLDQHWQYSRLKYPICFLSRTGREMLTFVRSMMEWLGGTISKEDIGEEMNGGKKGGKRRKEKADDDENEDALGAFALRFPHLEFFPNPQALLQTYSSKAPKLILAVPANLSHGPSRALFADFAAVPDNVVLLTSVSEEGTLGRVLFDKWNDSQRPDDKWDKGKIGSNVMMDGMLRLRINSKVPLQGAELDEFLEKERLVKEKEAAQNTARLQQEQHLLEADADDSDTDSDEEDDEDEVDRSLGGDMLDFSSDLRDPAAGFAEPGVDAGGERKKAGAKATRDGDWGLDTDEGLNKTMLSYDIYLKGNVSRATSFFKSADGQQRERFRMFPYVERKRRVDEYGETIDVSMWMRKGKVLEEAEKEGQDIQLQVEDEAKKAPLEPPSKFISSDIEIQLACRLLFVDLEGLNDGRAVKTIVPQVNPRKMIIVDAPSDATDALIESCANIRAMTKDIFAPAQGEEVRIGQQTASFSISLSDEFLSTIKMSRFEDNEIGFVTGRIMNHAGATVPTLEPLTALPSSKPAQQIGATRGRMLGSRPRVTLPHSTLIGELKLTALKARLAMVGIQADLVGEGVLICGKRSSGSTTLEDAVAVKKTGRGKVEMEGSVSDVYYAVRKEVYNLHALVAQG